MEPEQLSASPASLSGAAAELHDLAHDLKPGVFDLFLLDEAGEPRSHPDVDAAMRTFGEFARDQYQDVAALLVALSTRVSAAAGGYRDADLAAAAELTTLLATATYVPSSGRPD
ncbi:hypothetical protein [Cryptosporangium japonicum]|uniref:Uncharacterized protein n=1 Tax=Cryptosporangium japonicum TaxID=80872 RepID=A0ABP3D2S1_9ACTN